MGCDLKAKQIDFTGAAIDGVAAAWVLFNGSGTVSITDDFNVSSITDNGLGDFSINFTTALNNANYAAVHGGYFGGTNTPSSSILGGIGIPFGFVSVTHSTTVYRVGYYDQQTTNRDGDAISVVFFST